MQIPKQATASRILNSLLGAWRCMDGLGGCPTPFEEAKINNKNEKDREYYDKRSSQVLIVISTLWLSSISAGAIFFN